MKKFRYCSLIFFGLLVFNSGCISKIIKHPGLSGRFIWRDTGAPIVGERVIYTHRDRILETRTGPLGEFSFAPVYTTGYTGYPTSPASLSPNWRLLLGDDSEYISNGGPGWVNQTAVSRATLDMGTVEINERHRIANEKKKKKIK